MPGQLIVLFSQWILWYISKKYNNLNIYKINLSVYTVYSLKFSSLANG